MARSVHIRRIVALFLCCLLVFRSAIPVAHAVEPISASLSIAAGAVALGGLSAAAVESTIGPQVAAIIGTTMQGLGTSTYTSEESAITKTQYIMSKIAVWCVQAKIAKEDFYRRVAEGVTVAANGTIQLSHDASKLISQFISWVFTQGQDTVVPEVPAAETYVQFGDFKFAPISTGYCPITGIFTSPYSGNSFSIDRFQFFNVPANASILFLAGGTQLVVLVPGRVSFPGNGHGSALSGSTNVFTFNFGSLSSNYVSDKDGNYFTIAYCQLAGFSVSSSPSGVYSINYNTFKTEIAGKTHSIVDSSATDAVFVGQKVDWDENKDLLNPAIDDVTTLTPDLINKLIDQLADGQTATMDIATYLDSLVDAFDGLKSQVAEITDAVTGIQDSLAVPDSLTSVVTNETEDPDSDPGYEPEKVDPPGVVENLCYPLKDYFPFCIPFDLYALFQIFNAEPVAPSFTIDYTFPVVNGIPIHIDVDLSDWDSLASTVRFLEVVSFIVGLAVATRRLFIRV